ncbi:hypothetical protein GCM10011572_17080 [Pseudoduganella buxea]|uniref:Uncharacterized protein n=1 Tax=Pseudoduganella buxea TaxID=1949069 RepID=A0ABQ1KHE0_9BURK|nr:hypothetical protein GCM10011572_17080 [Pseudoduganella buxea]
MKASHLRGQHTLQPRCIDIEMQRIVERSGGVENGLDAAQALAQRCHHALHRGWIGHVAGGEFDRAGTGTGLPALPQRRRRRTAAQHHDARLYRVDQPLGQQRADTARAAGDEADGTGRKGRWHGGGRHGCGRGVRHQYLQPAGGGNHAGGRGQPGARAPELLDHGGTPVVPAGPQGTRGKARGFQPHATGERRQAL